MDYRDRITVDPSVRSEKPCIRGTRITVADVFDYLGGGMSIAGILDDFPRSNRQRHPSVFCIRSRPRSPDARSST